MATSRDSDGTTPSRSGFSRSDNPLERYRRREAARRIRRQRRNARKHVRVPATGAVELRPLAYGDRALEADAEQYFPGRLRDVSLGGLGFTAAIQLPVEITLDVLSLPAPWQGPWDTPLTAVIKRRMPADGAPTGDAQPRYRYGAAWAALSSGQKRHLKAEIRRALGVSD